MTKTLSVVQVVAHFLDSRGNQIAEVVAFNCQGSKDETADEQARRYASIFMNVGNRMVESIAKTTGATEVKYRSRDAMIFVTSDYANLA